MKKIALLFFLFVCQNHFGQELSLQIVSENVAENAIIDSLNYKRKHSNIKSILAEAQQYSNQLLQIGFLENKLLDSKKLNDTLYQFKFKLGLQTKSIHVYVGKVNTYLNFPTDTIVLPIYKTKSFMNEQLQELELKGFSLATLRLINFQKEDKALKAELNIDLNRKRTLDEIVIKGYDKFPKGHKRNIQKLYRKKTFNKSNLEKIYKNFNNFRFVKQTRYPEILFSEDSTNVYIYLEKAKANKFDGYIGFANDENQKINFTGYLDLALSNILNSGEEFNLYWKADDNKQVTFNAGIEIPYIFKSNLGIKANLNIFKQDSVFQNTKTAINLGYYFTYNKKLFLGYQSTESSDIQNKNTSLISDYNSTFFTATFEYKNYIDDFLFPEKTKLVFKAGFGDRTSKLNTDNQAFFELNAGHDFQLSKNNSLYIRSHNFYLKSNNFITNELHHFGGITSIRGFNENSLQGNTFISILSEYRYILSRNLYIHSVLDYGFYQDDTVKTNNRLLGLGFGVGILSKNGLLNLIYANGSAENQVIKLPNSVVHIKFITQF